MATLTDGILRQTNLPNIITLCRAVSPILLMPAMVFLPLHIGFWLFGLAALSDMEGVLARAMKCTTPLGEVFDPIADKLLINGMLIASVFMTGDAAIAALFVINAGYDVDNTFQRLPIIAKAINNIRVPNTLPVTLVSKGKTVVLFFTVSTTLLSQFTQADWQSVGSLARVLQPLALLTPFAVLMSILLVAYCWWQNRRRWVWAKFE